MPRYVYQCDHCLEIVELTRRVKDRNKRVECPTGDGHECHRHIGLEQCSTNNLDWDHPVLSERMGVSPSQVMEHRQRHPNIPITDTGEIIVTNGAEERRINRELASDFGKR